MIAKAAKQIPLQKILQQLGHKPAKEIHGELWYYSPFRNEKEPSFKINPEKNVWYDFGHGEGGNVLDFIMILYDITDISTALKQLSDYWYTPRATKTKHCSVFAKRRAKIRLHRATSNRKNSRFRQPSSHTVSVETRNRQKNCRALCQGNLLLTEGKRVLRPCFP